METKTTLRNIFPFLINLKTGEKFSLLKKENIIGRENSDIIIKEPTVSRHHAKIIINDNKIILKDLNSTNGTYVNGSKITEIELHNNDKIKFDVFEFTIQIPSAEPSTVIHKAEQTTEPEERKTKILEPEKINYGVFTVLNGKFKDEKFFMKKEKIIIGREDSDININEDIISRHHCEVEYKDKNFFVKDLNSTNYTFVNNKQISKTELKTGDVIKLGDIELKFMDLITEQILREGTQQMDESIIKQEISRIEKNKKSKLMYGIIASTIVVIGILIWIFLTLQKSYEPVKSINLNKTARFFTQKKVSSKPLLVKEKLFVASEDKNLYVVDNNTFSALNTIHSKYKFKSNPVYIKGSRKIIAINEYGNIFSLSVDGKLTYTTPNSYIKGKITASPILADLDDDGIKDIIIGSKSKIIYAVNGKTLEKLWEKTVSGSIIKRGVIADVNSDKIPDVFVVCKNGNLYCLNGKNGDIIWNYSLGEKVVTSPALMDFNLDNIKDFIVASYYGDIVIFNGINGAILAKVSLNTKIVASPVVGDMNNDKIDDIVIGTKDGFIISINGEDGSILNKINTDTQDEIIDNIVLMDVTFDNYPEVIFGSRNSFMYILDTTKGAILAKSSAGSGITTKFVIADINNDGYPEFICGTRSGEVAVFSIVTVPEKDYGHNKIFKN